ncbi:YdcF family protein [Parvibaculaceae bacterium PLY_AMNH_Bact1]|nr:YdcF family protein [Parvibaculaceae bacterium PLY_AMNH_Bact1]
MEETTPIPDLDAALVERINKEHLIETPLKPADLLFIFGTRHGVAEFIEEAARLWRGGFYRHAIVSGGITPGGLDPEGIVMKQLMVEAGIPDEIILTETRASNTGENVSLSLPIIEREIGLANIQSVIAIGKLCTSRRYLMTLERHWPDVEKMLAPINWFGVPRADWHLHPLAKQRVLSEVAKIEPYLEKGFIAEWLGTRLS